MLESSSSLHPPNFSTSKISRTQNIMSTILKSISNLSITQESNSSYLLSSLTPLTEDRRTIPDCLSGLIVSTHAKPSVWNFLKSKFPLFYSLTQTLFLQLLKNETSVLHFSFDHLYRIDLLANFSVNKTFCP